jgi:Na+/H+ antiporter NhaD/arsenite permease-like protein
MSQFWFAVALFVLTYAIIISEKLNRAVAALMGAILMAGLGILDIHKAFSEYIEWGTITLLIGMMILVGITNQTGVFEYVAIRSVKWAKGSPSKILVIFSLLTGITSAFLDNVTTVLLIAPITFSITRMLDINPIPFLISEVLASNIGGTATLIGDPPNIMIGSANPHLTFNQFLIHLTPIVMVILAVTVFLLYLIYRKQLNVKEEDKQKLLSLNEHEYIKDPVLMKRSLIVLAITILGFILHSVIHVDASVIAIGGATLLLLIGIKQEEVEKAFDTVEWESIFFFAALFTLVGGLQEVGAIKRLAESLLDLTNNNLDTASYFILWGSGIASAFIDNIPFVATMIPLIQDMAHTMGIADNSPEINALWWSLALGACLGGNGTIIGASANVIVAGLAAREGKPISYWTFLKVAAPLTLISLLFSHVYIWLRYQH